MVRTRESCPPKPWKSRSMVSDALRELQRVQNLIYRIQDEGPHLLIGNLQQLQGQEEYLKSYVSLLLEHPLVDEKEWRKVEQPIAMLTFLVGRDDVYPR